MMRRLVALVKTDFSEERIPSIITVERSNELGKDFCRDIASSVLN
jgi:hypothetical protein